MHFLKYTELADKWGQSKKLLLQLSIYHRCQSKFYSDPIYPTHLSEVHASTASVISFSPGISSAQADSTSELLRFL